MSKGAGCWVLPWLQNHIQCMSAKILSERKNIILRKLRSRILKYILHRYINSNNFTKKENDFKVVWPQYSNKTLQHCKGA